MWSRSNKSDDGRKKSSSSSSKRRAESLVSSSSARNPSRSIDDRPAGPSSRNSYPPAPASVASSYATFATAPDGPRSEFSRAETMPVMRGEYEDDSRSERRRNKDKGKDRDRSSSRDRERKSSTGGWVRDKKDKDRDRDRSGKDKDDDKKKKKKKSSKDSATGQSIVDFPSDRERGSFSRAPDMSYSSQFPGQFEQQPSPHQYNPSSIPNQFPGQDPSSFAEPFRPPLSTQEGGPGLASDFYGDQGQSVQTQPGIRPDIVMNSQPHLMAPSAQAAPPTETGAGAAMEFYGNQMSDGPGPSKPPRPSQYASGSGSEKPNKYGKVGSAAALAGTAALGYEASQHHSHQQSASTNGTSFYQQGANFSTTPTMTGSHFQQAHDDGSTILGGYASSASGKPSKKPGKHSSHSNVLPYAAGAAGLAAGAHYLHNQHGHHQHSHSMPAGNAYGLHGGGHGYVSGGLATHQKQRGPVGKFVDWWKDYEDVEKMEEYTEYIGVCRDCFDPNSGPWMGPRKHHYHGAPLRRRRSGEGRRSTEFNRSRINKGSRYGYDGGHVYSDDSSDDGRRRRRGSGNRGPGLIATGLAGIGLAKVGKALWRRDNDFDDTYSVRSGHAHGSRSRSSFFANGRRGSSSSSSSARSRSRSKASYGVVRHRSRSRGRDDGWKDVKDRKDKAFVSRRASRSRSRSRHKSGGLFSAAVAASAGAGAAHAASKHYSKSRRSRSRSRSKSPTKSFVRRRDSSRERHQRDKSPGLGAILGLTSDPRNERARRGTHRSAASGSFIDISRSDRRPEKTGVLGGFFSPDRDRDRRRENRKAERRKHRASSSHSRKNSGFFNFGNSSNSSSLSSASDMAYGPGFVRRQQSNSSIGTSRSKKKGIKRKSSDEKLKATLVGLGATTAALAAAKHHHDKGKYRHGRRTPELVSGPSGRRHIDPYLGSRRRHDDDDGEWENVSDAGSVSTVDSSALSSDSGLAFGDFDVKGKGRKSTESLVSNESGTNKWGWRWGFGGKKKRSSSSLREHQRPSYAGPALAGAAAGAAVGAMAGGADSSSSTLPTLQSVYPASTADPNVFDAIQRTPSLSSNQATPLVSRSTGTPLVQPQPLAPVSNSVYTTQASYQPGYVAPAGPPVFAGPSSRQVEADRLVRPVRTGSLSEVESHRPPPRRGNSSPVFSSNHIARDAAIAGVGGAVAAGILTAAGSKRDRGEPSPSNVRFDLTKEQHARAAERDTGSRRKNSKDDRTPDWENEREQRKRDRERQRQEEERKREEEHRAKERERERIRQVELREREETERIARERREAEAREIARRETEAQAERAREAERIHLEKEAAARIAQKKSVAAGDEAQRLQRQYEEAKAERERLESAIYEQEVDLDDARSTVSSSSKKSKSKGKKAEKKAKEKEEELEKSKSRAEELDRIIAYRESELRERENDIIDPSDWRTGSKPSTKSALGAGIMGAAAGAVIANMAHVAPSTAPRDLVDKRDALGRYDEYLYDSGSDFDPVVAKKQAKQKFPKDPSKSSDPSSEADAIRRDAIVRKAANKVVADVDRKYQPSAKVDPAEFFAPEELRSGSRSPSIDPNADSGISIDNNISTQTSSRGPPYMTPYAFTTSDRGADDFDDRGRSATSKAVPSLILTQPTPDGSYAGSVRSATSPSPAPPSQPVKQDPPQRTRSGSRVSWGADQTFSYEVTTPEDHLDEFIDDHHAKKAQVHDDYSRPTSSEGPTTDTRSTPSMPSKPEDTRGSPYSAPFYDSVSDFAAPEPKTGHGFVQDVTDEPEEMIIEDDQHMPGAFDDEEPVQPKLSKKERKKAEKAARREAEAAGVDSGTASTAAAAAVAGLGAAAVAATIDSAQDKTRDITPDVAVDDFEIPLSKKERKKREKAAKRASLTEDVPTSHDVPETFSAVSEPDYAKPEESLFEEQSSKKKKKEDKKRQSQERDPRDIEPAWPSPEDTIRTVPSETSEASRERNADIVDAYHQLRESRDRETKLHEYDLEHERNGSREMPSEIGPFPARSKEETSNKNRSHSESPEDRKSSSKGFSFADAASFITGPSAMKKGEPNDGMPKDPGSSPTDDRPWTIRTVEPERAIPSTAFDDVDELADVKTPTKKSKRRSVGPNSPTSPGSPLRREISNEDYLGSASSRARESLETADDTTAGVLLADDSPDQYESATGSPTRSPTQNETVEDEYESRRRRHHRSSSDRYDDARSVTSESAGYEDHKRRKHHRRRESERDDDDDTRSIAAASAPGDLYERERKRDKHRSRHHHHSDIDDTASITSSPAKYEEKKEKKGGLLSGLFGKKQDLSVPDTASSSSGKHHHRHRSSRSESGAYEDDDLESMTSSGRRRRKHHHGSRHGSSYGGSDEEGDRKERRHHKRRSTSDYGDEHDYERRSDKSASGTSSRHHDNEQSFLGDRVEESRSATSDIETPPPVKSPRPTPVFLPTQTVDALALDPSELPLPVSRPGSPPLPDEEPIPRTPTLSESRATSKTAIPLRFLRRGSASPSMPRDSLTLNTQSALSSPSLPREPASAPAPRHSKSSSTEFKSTNEFRPLYLVERNSKPLTLDESELLPSLPSSHTTSRTSSVHGSDEAWESALESPEASTRAPASVAGSVSGSEALVYDSAVEDHGDLRDEQDFLDSQQPTPRAPRSPVLAPQPALAPPISDHTSAAQVAAAVAAGGIIGAAAEKLLRERSKSRERSRDRQFAIENDFFGGEVSDTEVPDEFLPAPETPVTPSREAPPASPTASKKAGKKGKKGKKLSKGSISSISEPETPTGETAEERQARRELDAQDAVDGWFAASEGAAEQHEKKSVPPSPIEAPPQAPPPAALLRRESIKGKKGKKKGKGSAGKVTLEENVPPEFIRGEAKSFPEAGPSEIDGQKVDTPGEDKDAVVDAIMNPVSTDDAEDHIAARENVQTSFHDAQEPVVTFDVAPVSEPVPQLQDETDLSASVPARKLSKKEKRKAKRTGFFLDEAADPEEPVPSSEAFKDDAATLPDNIAREITQGELASTDSAAEEPPVQNAPEDSLPQTTAEATEGPDTLPTRKLSKKEKRKAKKSAIAFGGDEYQKPEEPQESAFIQPSMDDEPSMPDNITGETTDLVPVSANPTTEDASENSPHAPPENTVQDIIDTTPVSDDGRLPDEVVSQLAQEDLDKPSSLSTRKASKKDKRKAKKVDNALNEEPGPREEKSVAEHTAGASEHSPVADDAPEVAKERAPPDQVIEEEQINESLPGENLEPIDVTDRNSSKKEKRKAKKVSNLLDNDIVTLGLDARGPSVSEEEPSLPENIARDISGTEPASDVLSIAPEQDHGAVDATASSEIPDSAASFGRKLSKKEKRKAKRTNTISFDEGTVTGQTEQQSIDLEPQLASAIEQAIPIAKDIPDKGDDPAETDPTPDLQGSPELKPVFERKMSKKEKRKAKKAGGFSLDDEPLMEQPDKSTSELDPQLAAAIDKVAPFVEEAPALESLVEPGEGSGSFFDEQRDPQPTTALGRKLSKKEKRKARKDALHPDEDVQEVAPVSFEQDSQRSPDQVPLSEDPVALSDVLSETQKLEPTTTPFIGTEKDVEEPKATEPEAKGGFMAGMFGAFGAWGRRTSRNIDPASVDPIEDISPATRPAAKTEGEPVHTPAAIATEAVPDEPLLDEPREEANTQSPIHTEPREDEWAPATSKKKFKKGQKGKKLESAGSDSFIDSTSVEGTADGVSTTGSAPKKMSIEQTNDDPNRETSIDREIPKPAEELTLASSEEPPLSSLVQSFSSMDKGVEAGPEEEWVVSKTKGKSKGNKEQSISFTEEPQLTSAEAAAPQDGHPKIPVEEPVSEDITQHVHETDVTPNLASEATRTQDELTISLAQEIDPVPAERSFNEPPSVELREELSADEIIASLSKKRRKEKKAKRAALARHIQVEASTTEDPPSQNVPTPSYSDEASKGLSQDGERAPRKVDDAAELPIGNAAEVVHEQPSSSELGQKTTERENVDDISQEPTSVDDRSIQPYDRAAAEAMSGDPSQEPDPAPEPSQEEESAVSWNAPTRKGKKGKKTKRTSLLKPDPQPDIEQDKFAEPFDHSLSGGESQSTKAPAGDEVHAEVKDTSQDHQQPEQLETWDESPPEKSKEIEEHQRISDSAPETDVEPTSEPPPSSIQYEDSTQSPAFIPGHVPDSSAEDRVEASKQEPIQIENENTENAETQPHEEPATEMFLSGKKGKKNKKSKKSKALGWDVEAVPEDPMSNISITNTAEDSTILTDIPAAITEGSAETPPIDDVDHPSPPTEVHNIEGSDVLQANQSTEQAPIQEVSQEDSNESWSMLPSRKSKKEKRKERRAEKTAAYQDTFSAEEFPSHDGAPEDLASQKFVPSDTVLTEPASEETVPQNHLASSHDIPDPPTDSAVGDASIDAIPRSEPTVDVDLDEEFGFSTKKSKKEKKAKKVKKAEAIESATDEPQPNAKFSHEDTEAPNIESQPGESLDGQTTPQDSMGTFSPFSAVPASSPLPEDVVSAPEQNTWLPTKKNKKDKRKAKKAKGIESPAEPPASELQRQATDESIPVAADVPARFEGTPHEISDPGPEDSELQQSIAESQAIEANAEEEFGFTKKKSKKDKSKAKKKEATSSVQQSLSEEQEIESSAGPDQSIAAMQSTSFENSTMNMPSHLLRGPDNEPTEIGDFEVQEPSGSSPRISGDVNTEEIAPRAAGSPPTAGHVENPDFTDVPDSRDNLGNSHETNLENAKEQEKRVPEKEGASLAMLSSEHDISNDVDSAVPEASTSVVLEKEPDPQFTLTPSGKGKKGKKAKKSQSRQNSVPLDEPEPIQEILEESQQQELRVPENHQLVEEPQYSEAPQAETSFPEASVHVQPSTGPIDTADPATATTETLEDSAATTQDIDFAATLAAGLEGSGFDPNLVIEDPIFHRRTTPPNAAGEADPEEAFQNTKKSKKGRKKQRRVQEAHAAEEESFGLPDPSQDATKVAPTTDDGFDAVLAAGMAATGFDPSEIEKAASSGRGSPSPETDRDLTFSTARLKKKRKGKKAQDFGSEATGTSTPVEADTPKDAKPQELTPNADFPVVDTGMSWADEMDAEEPIIVSPLRATPQEEKPANVPSTIAEDEWAAPPKKKGKKGKKGKSMALFEEADQSSPTPSTPTNEPAGSQAFERVMPEVAPGNAEVQEVEDESISKENERKKAPARTFTEIFANSTENDDRTVDKSGNESQEIDLQETLSSSEPANDPLSRPDFETVGKVEDNPALAGRGKKSKKGKKSQRGKFTEPEIEAPPEDDLLARSTPRELPSTDVPTTENDREDPTSESAHRDQDSSGFVTKKKGKKAKRQAPSRMPTDLQPPGKRIDGPEPSPTISRTAKEDLDVAVPASFLAGASIQPSWSFPPNRDSALQISDSEALPHGSLAQSLRDSGFQDGSDHPARHDPPAVGTIPSSPPTAEIPAEGVDVNVELDPSWGGEISLDKVPSSSLTQQDMGSRPMTPDQDSPTLPERDLQLREATPSGVESMSKDRTSYLFKSSPTSREVAAQLAALGESPNQKAEPSEPETPIRDLPYEEPRVSGEPVRSIFGGPLEEDAPTSRHIRTPSAPLDTIAEYSPDSPLSKKSRPVTDVGTPDRNIKSRRSGTPSEPQREPPRSSDSHYSGHPGSRDVTPLSTDDILKRMSWPSVDDDQETVNLERSLSRQHNRKRIGQHSTPSSAERRLPSAVDFGRNSSPSTPERHDVDPIKRQEGIRSPTALSERSGASISRLRTPDLRPMSSLSHRSSTPPLRRMDRSASGDLRAASKLGAKKSAQANTKVALDPPTSASHSRDPSTNKSRGIAMADIFEGRGESPGSPLSPTRPPSVRKRQSMQILDLQSHIDRLSSENQRLQEIKEQADQAVRSASVDVNGHAVAEAVASRDTSIREKDAEISRMRGLLENVRQEVARLAEANASLTAANRQYSEETNNRYAELEAENRRVRHEMGISAAALVALQATHSKVKSGMENVVRDEISRALDDKNDEIERLHNQLNEAMAQIKSLQGQIVEQRQDQDFLRVRDEDFVESACQELFDHVNHWVQRFSKYSDTRVCKLSTETADDKIETRLDNAILDGSDVDMLLADRKQRRNVFMSVVMTMIWEYVFTRYLFGMDREQRSKLKTLEKTLSEVGPQRAVAQWRVVTLTLLSKRPAFMEQRRRDTEAVVNEIYTTLATLLPPPSQHQKTIRDSLFNVMKRAVDLSIEMRTQRPEYIMLPPLQPEYDTNGDLVRKVHFNPELMHEQTEEVSDEDLGARNAVVKIVLFPLVVKKGDDLGNGEDEIVVSPAKVLVQKPRDKKVVRVMSGAMEIDEPGNRSMTSLLPESQMGSAF